MPDDGSVQMRHRATERKALPNALYSAPGLKHYLPRANV
jgi:hypothetical protein